MVTKLPRIVKMFAVEAHKLHIKSSQYLCVMVVWDGVVHVCVCNEQIYLVVHGLPKLLTALFTVWAI